MALTLGEIRRSYPEYDDLDDIQLADAIRSKFYPDIDQGEFYRLVDVNSDMGDFTKGVARGNDMLQSNLGAAMGALGEGLESEYLRQTGEEIRTRNQLEAQQYPAKVPRVEDIGGVGDAVDYAQGLIGEQVPQLGGTLALALGGGAVAGPVGALGAAGLSSYAQSVGETQSNLLDKGVDPAEAAKTSALLGIPMAALDVITPMRAARRLAIPAGKMAGSAQDAAARAAFAPITVRGRTIASGRPAAALRGLRSDAKAEGITEFLQEQVQMFGEAYHDVGPEGAEWFSRSLNAAVGGATVGGAMGGVSGALSRAPKTEQALADETEAAVEKVAQLPAPEKRAALPPPGAEFTGYPGEPVPPSGPGPGDIGAQDAPINPWEPPKSVKDFVGGLRENERVTLATLQKVAKTRHRPTLRSWMNWLKGSGLVMVRDKGGDDVTLFRTVQPYDPKAKPAPPAGALVKPQPQEPSAPSATPTTEQPAVAPEPPQSDKTQAETPGAEQPIVPPLRVEGDEDLPEKEPQTPPAEPEATDVDDIVDNFLGQDDTTTGVQPGPTSPEPPPTGVQPGSMTDDDIASGLEGLFGGGPKGDGTKTAPIEVKTPEDLDAARPQVNPEPTDGQKEAGNYKHAHVKWQGLDVAIETGKGQERRGKAKDGKEWSVTMPADYGRLKRTEGADGDQVDIYLGPTPDAGMVYVVDQKDPDTGQFDEHKVMAGFGSRDEALSTYSAAFNDGSGPDRIGGVTEMSVDDFKTWLKTADTKKPLGGTKKTEKNDNKALRDEQRRLAEMLWPEKGNAGFATDKERRAARRRMIEISELLGEERASDADQILKKDWVDDIHDLADEKRIPWDDDLGFMNATKELTGKERLDDLDPDELRNVYDSLQKAEARPGPEAYPPATMENRQGKFSVGSVRFANDRLVKEYSAEDPWSRAEAFGRVPNNENVVYSGAVAWMKPWHFLALAAKVNPGEAGLESVNYLQKAISAGHPVGTPFLTIDFDETGTPKIRGHEGRNRMTAIKNLQPDQEIPVHIFGYKARELTEEKVKALFNVITAERSADRLPSPISKLWVGDREYTFKDFENKKDPEKPKAIVAGTEAHRKAISRATGKKGVPVFFLKGPKAQYDPLIRAMRVDPIQVAADDAAIKEAADLAKIETPLGWSTIEVDGVDENGEQIVTTAGAAAQDLGGRLRRAMSVLECVSAS